MPVKNKLVVTYCLLLLVISWILQAFAISSPGGINGKSAEGWLVATMFTPMLLTIIFLVKFKHLRPLLRWRPKWNSLWLIAAAVVVITAIAFKIIALASVMGYGNSGWFTFNGSTVNISGGPWLLGKGDQGWLIFIANVFVTGIAYSLFNAIPAAGEEFAWRGFIQGIFIDNMGMTKGIIVLGLLWSFWHLPALLAGYNYPDNPVLGSFLLSPVELVSVSFFFAWLTIKAKSFLPAAVAHGAGNSIQEGIISNFRLTVPHLYLDLLRVGITLFVGFIFWIILKKQEEKTTRGKLPLQR